MITTVTTTTVTTIATVTSISLAGAAIFTLLALLILKEIVSGIKNNGKYLQLSKALNVAILPLLIVFAFTAVVQLIQFFVVK